MATIYSRDISESGLVLGPLIGATITSVRFIPYDKVVITFDTGDILTVSEESQTGDISVDLSN